MVALSFASDAEANIFYKTVTATIASRTKKRRSRKFSPAKQQSEGSQDTGYDSGVVLRNQNSTGKLLDPFHLVVEVRVCNSSHNINVPRNSYCTYFRSHRVGRQS